MATLRGCRVRIHAHLELQYYFNVLRTSVT